MFKSPTRNHISIIIERLGAVLLFLLAMGYSQLFNNVSDIVDPEFWRGLITATGENRSKIFLSGGGLIILSIGILIWSFMRWRKTFFYIKNTDFIFERRTIMKSYITLPVRNIATVNLERNIFERLAGTSKVKIDLNSSRTANKTDFAIVLKAPLAEQLRADLLALKSVQSGSEPVTEPGVNTSHRQIIHFTFSEALRHKVLSAPIVQMLVGYSALILSPIFGDAEADYGKIFMTIGLLLIGSIATMVWGALNLGNYSVGCDKNNIYVDYGIVKKSTYTFEKSKVNGLVIRRPLIARIFGYCSVEVAVVGIGNEKNETPQLCLLVKNNVAHEIIKDCVPDFICNGESFKYHKAGIPMAIWRSVKLAALTLPVLFTPLNHSYIICIAVFCLALINNILNCVLQSIAYDDEKFRYTKGVLSQYTGVLKYGDIQSIKLKTNFVIKSKNASKLSLTILSGSKFSSHSTGFFDNKHYNNIIDKMVEHSDTAVRM